MKGVSPTQSTKPQKKGKVLSVPSSITKQNKNISKALTNNTSMKIFSDIPKEVEENLKKQSSGPKINPPPKLHHSPASPSQKNSQTFKITTLNNMYTSQNCQSPLVSLSQSNSQPVKINTPNKTTTGKTVSTQSQQSSQASIKQLTTKNTTPQKMYSLTYIQKPSTTNTTPPAFNCQKSINTTPTSQKTFTNCNIQSSPIHLLKVGQTPSRNNSQKGSPLNNASTQQDLSPLNEIIGHSKHIMASLKNKLQCNIAQPQQLTKSPANNLLKNITNQNLFSQKTNTPHQSPILNHSSNIVNFSNTQSKSPILQNLHSLNSTTKSPNKNLVLKKTTVENTSTQELVFNIQQPSPTSKKSLKNDQIAKDAIPSQRMSSISTQQSTTSALNQNSRATSVLTHTNTNKSKTSNNTDTQTMSTAGAQSPRVLPLKSMEELAKDLLSSPSTSTQGANNQIQSSKLQKDKTPQQPIISTGDVKNQQQPQTTPSTNIDVSFISKFYCVLIFSVVKTLDSIMFFPHHPPFSVSDLF